MDENHTHMQRKAPTRRESHPHASGRHPQLCRRVAYRVQPPMAYSPSTSSITRSACVRPAAAMASRAASSTRLA